jgi:hypothetical protein
MSGCRIWSLATIGRDSGSGGAVHVLVHPPSAHPIDHQVAQPRRCERVRVGFYGAPPVRQPSGAD